MADGERRAVLLLAHGTPDSLEEIPEYLKNVTGGRALPESVIEEIRHRYAKIGRSPLTELTLMQGQLLEDRLQMPVYVGMRNWSPYIRDVVQQMIDDGINAAIAICLAPQNSRTSVGLYRKAVLAAAADTIRIDFVEGWADDPLLAQAFAQKLLPAWKGLSERIGTKAPVVFTAHSVPCRTIQTQAANPAADEGDWVLPAPSAAPDPYPVEAKRTAELVAQRLAGHGLGETGWVFAFQSQGMSGGPWIGPTVEDTLTALSQQGHRAVVIQPIGFLCDHIEVLYDIDVAFREHAAGLGMALERTESLNGSPLLIEALADIVHKRFGEARRKLTSEVVPSHL